jgi:large subunit ribosomal protein L35
MPKMKTHKATAKRVKISGGGKMLHRAAGASHLLSKKSAQRKRRLAILAPVARVDVPRFKKIISPRGDL